MHRRDRHRSAGLIAALGVLSALWAAPSGAQPTAEFLTGHVDSHGATLTWALHGAVDFVRCYRREGPGPWITFIDTVARPVPDIVRVEDRTVTPRFRYDYRLGLHANGVETFSDSVRIHVPPLAIQGVFARMALIPGGLQMVWVTSEMPEVTVERRRQGETVWQELGTVAPDESGYVRWDDHEPDTGERLEYRIRWETHVRGQHSVDVPDPQAMLLPHELNSRSASLGWQVIGKSADVIVQRREGEGAWSTIGYRVPDSNLRVGYVDGPVFPGRTYTYRVGLVGVADRVYSGEIEVTIPHPIEFAIARAAWEHESRRVLVELATPLNAAVLFEFFDAAGRPRYRSSVRLVPGAHQLWLEPGPLPPGVYFVRAHVHDRSATARFAAHP